MSNIQRIFNANIAPAHGAIRNITTITGWRRKARSIVWIAGCAVLLSIAQSGIVAAAGTDLSVTLSVSTSGELVYTAVVTNNGPLAAQSVVLKEQLPSGVVNVSVTPSSCTFFPNGGLKCSLGPMVPTATQTVVVTLHPITTGDKTAQAFVSSELSDPSPSNNTASATATITAVGISDVAITMTTPNPVTVGANLSYTATIQNLGDDDAQGVTFVDTVPASAHIVGAISSVGPCTLFGATVTCAIGSLGVQGSATVHIVMKPNATGPFYNVASATPSTVDPNLTNNAVTTLTWVNP